MDHICATSAFNNTSTNDELLGYKIRFIQNNIPINKEKKDVLLDDAISHDALFLTNSVGISIELINHYTNNVTQFGKYRVIYESSKLPDVDCILVENDKTAKYVSSIFNEPLTKIFNKRTNLSFFWKRSEKDNGITTISLETKNLENSIGFWTKNFNFKTSPLLDTSSSKLIELHSPITSWNAKLLFIENPDLIIEKTFLNLSGWTCISFIVKKIDSFLGQIDQSDFSFIGKPYELSLGGKSLKLVFLRGPEQQLIELVEVARNHD